jgi:hypothetical protein
MKTTYAEKRVEQLINILAVRFELRGSSPSHVPYKRPEVVTPITLSFGCQVWRLTHFLATVLTDCRAWRLSNQWQVFRWE